MDFNLFNFKLASGSHPNATAGTCFMEAVAWMADEKHSDAPQCACPVLGRFGIRLNDRMTDDERKLLNPLILKMMNTRSKAHEEIRAAHLLHGVATRTLPVIFELRGAPELAAMLRAIPVGATRAQMVAPLRAVRDAAEQRKKAAAAAADAAAYAYAAAYAAAAAAAAADAAAYAAAYAAADAAAAAAAYVSNTATWKESYAKYRAQFIGISVDLLNEAIEIGPHNSQEFYDVPTIEQRVAAFSKVLQPAS